MDDNYLSHYGIPGMKWGARKSKSSSGSSKRKRSNSSYKKEYNKKVKQQKKNKYSDISNLSDQELRNRINRMQMERQYSSLLKDQSHAVRTGKNKTDGILKQEGKNTLKRGVKKAIKTATKI